MKRKGRRGLIAVLLILLLGLGGYAWLGISLREPFQAYPENKQIVSIPKGMSVSSIGRRLVEMGIVRNEWIFRIAVLVSGQRNLKAGEFQFDRPMNPLEVVHKLAHGEIERRWITFPEGLTIEQMARIYEDQGFGEAVSFIDASQQVELIADLDAEASDLEGYLFPDSYSLSPSTTASELVLLMVEQFRKEFNEELRQEAQAKGLTPRQIVTLASLIEKETSQPEERPLIAAVFWNRLEIGM